MPITKTTFQQRRTHATHHLEQIAPIPATARFTTAARGEKSYSETRSSTIHASPGGQP